MKLGNFYIALNSLILLLILNSCENKFKHKEYNWKELNPGSSNAQIFVDTNRIECLNGKCNVWTRIDYTISNATNVNQKLNPAERRLMVQTQSIRSQKSYNCSLQTSEMISYELYDQQNKLINSRWLTKPIIEKVQPNTVDYLIYQNVCL